jgi:hypothetical protein
MALRPLPIREQSLVTWLIWGALAIVALGALAYGRWSTAFVAGATLAITFLPLLFQSWSGVRIPRSFTSAIVFFTVATLFLGEVGDFYERFWWWDVVLHTGSAVGFGMIGTVIMLMLLQNQRIEASALMVSLFAFSFGVAIGAVWEIFEFAMDQMFGFNMQKSGLLDTMFDLIVDCIGAGAGAMAGYLYIKGRGSGWLTGTIDSFVRNNERLFGRAK